MKYLQIESGVDDICLCPANSMQENASAEPVFRRDQVEAQFALQAAELAATATRPGPAGVKSVPMFTMAATTGQGLSTLHTFLSHLQPRHPTPSPATSEPKRDNTSDALGGAAGPGAAPGDATEPGSPGGRMVPSVVDGADLAGAGQGGIREELRRGAHTDAQSFDEELVRSFGSWRPQFKNLSNVYVE